MAKILVIDDSKDVRDLVVKVLGSEHHVFTVEDWVDATQAIFTHSPDVILMDIEMPGLHGDQLTAALKKRVTSKTLNIVLFSSIDEAELRRRAKAAGAAGYIPKTFDGNVLRAKLKRFLPKV